MGESWQPRIQTQRRHRLPLRIVNGHSIAQSQRDLLSDHAAESFASEHVLEVDLPNDVLLLLRIRALRRSVALGEVVQLRHHNRLGADVNSVDLHACAVEEPVRW